VASLRSRLITWYITTGALVVLCLAALTAVLGMQMLAYQGHEALLSASRQVPAMAAPYVVEHPGDLRGLDTYLDQHLAPLPVVTHTEDRFGAPRRGDRRGPPRGPFNTNLVMRLLMDEVRPMEV
jgi:hypothetical protein